MSSLIEDYTLIGDCETAGLVSWEEFHLSKDPRIHASIRTKGRRNLSIFRARHGVLAGISSVWRGTTLDTIWTLNPRAHSELARLGKPIGLLFLSFAAALAIAGTGWLKEAVGMAVGRGH